MTKPTRRSSRDHRRERASAVLPAHATGPAAATEPTRRAMARLDEAQTVLLVEGVSDQIALEAVAERRGHDFAASGVLVVPIGGAQAIDRVLTALDPAVGVGGLCDAGEAHLYRAALTRAGLGRCDTHDDLERLGFFVCVPDLEAELIRAVGPRDVEEVFEQEGELGAFRTMQQQPPWRDRPIDEQMRRFLGSGARRKSRYARLLVEAVDDHHIPDPLLALVERAVAHS